MRAGVVAVVAATITQLLVLTASAAAPSVKLPGTVLDAKTDRAVSGIVLAAYAGSPQDQQKPLATTTTGDGGRFMLTLPPTQSLTTVTIQVIPTLDLPCRLLRLSGIVGAAQSLSARGASFPSASPDDRLLSTFEPMGYIQDADGDPCDWRIGSAGLHRNAPLE